MTTLLAASAPPRKASVQSVSEELRRLQDELLTLEKELARAAPKPVTRMQIKQQAKARDALLAKVAENAAHRRETETLLEVAHRADMLRRACAAGDLETVTELCGQPDRPVSIANSEGTSPLMKAAMFDRSEVIEVLLAAGAEPEQLDDRGRTALMLAAAGGNVAATMVLVDAGAACAATDHEGMTAFMHAAHGGHLECCGVLLEYGGAVLSLTARDKRGRTALERTRAAPQANAAVVAYLETELAANEVELGVMAHPSPLPLSAAGVLRESFASMRSIGSFGSMRSVGSMGSFTSLRSVGSVVGSRVSQALASASGIQRSTIFNRISRTTTLTRSSKVLRGNQGAPSPTLSPAVV